jgi:hypothetical protein
MKLKQVIQSPVAGKKYRAIYEDKDKVINVDFGASAYQDYTMHKDNDRKKLYLARHKKNENWNDPTTPGSLSRYLLWNKPTLTASIADFKKRFNV